MHFEINSLKTQVSRTSDVSALQSDLEDALGKVTTLETKTSVIREACVQLNKDLVFLEQQKHSYAIVIVTLYCNILVTFMLF